VRHRVRKRLQLLIRLLQSGGSLLDPLFERFVELADRLFGALEVDRSTKIPDEPLEWLDASTSGAVQRLS